MVRLRHFDSANTARFVTISCYHNHQFLTESKNILALLRELDLARSKYNAKLYGYVIMPEHVHLVMHTPADVELGALLREVKSKSARKIFCRIRDERNMIPRIHFDQNPENTNPRFWQLRGYDHNCRTLSATIEKIRYCHENPVRRNLVRRAEDWQWSSARWYAGTWDGAIEIDTIDEIVSDFARD